MMTCLARMIDHAVIGGFAVNLLAYNRSTEHIDVEINFINHKQCKTHSIVQLTY